MEKRFLAVDYWIDKTTGKIVTKFAQIIEGTSKVGNKFGKTDMEKTEIMEGSYPIGTIVSGTMALNVEKSDRANLKINQNA